MNKPVSIVITPRDRYSGLVKCIEQIYLNTDVALFELLILDLGYPKNDMIQLRQFLSTKDNYKIIEYGCIIPMEAMDRVRPLLNSPYTVFMDNDSIPLGDWLPPLITTANRQNAAVVYPVTLERAGVDDGADIRTHLYTTEFRVVDVENQPYLIEHKTYRRCLHEEIPKETTESQSFELHCVMFNTAIFKSIELPRITIREHLDIGLQLKARKLKLYVEPGSSILFDNLGTRAKFSDLRFFNLRWNKKITYQSSRLFEKRWGYKFYSEEATYNWARRRRLFIFLRWLYFPIQIANKIDTLYAAVQRRLFPIWDPLTDPYSQSKPLYELLNGSAPNQLDHTLNTAD
ncbi:MAG: hypothetical protein COA96_03540 [SAR86 cluster bacterium]|uniref:Glycosyltransferase 2-like domain-containing protein n=1 Tax=SAR86 cluster bacterium TaxID=2030880 RepID=A0A2A5B6W0_9GAMM|nr:MAG: hypothetical protein COA96_03540 [SAR86 cluster bacterium]